MKQYAEHFYKSRAWQECREAYLVHTYHKCERCGQRAKIVHHKKYISASNIKNLDITLSFDSLEALCSNCHNKEHNRNKTPLRYRFDNDGNVIPPHEQKFVLKG